jgi:hypothetical protein
LSQGILSKNLSNIVLGNLPYRVIVGLLDHRSVNGDYKKSAFEFKHFNLRSISLYVNGSSVGKSFTPQYKKENEFNLNARSYLNMFMALGNLNELGNGVSIEEFSNNLNIYAFDLTPDQSANSCSHVNPVKQGNISLQIEFNENLQESIVVLVYCEFNSVIEINKTREVTHDY